MYTKDIYIDVHYIYSHMQSHKHTVDFLILGGEYNGRDGAMVTYYRRFTSPRPPPEHSHLRLLLMASEVYSR